MEEATRAKGSHPPIQTADGPKGQPHRMNWIDAIQERSATCPFEYAGPLTETMLARSSRSARAKAYRSITTARMERSPTFPARTNTSDANRHRGWVI